MTIEEFKNSFVSDEAPPGISPELEALWNDAKGNWDIAHQMVQHFDDEDNAKIHAYLHREEGDISNAEYWYKKANTSKPDANLEDEFDELVNYFLNKKTFCTIDF